MWPIHSNLRSENVAMTLNNPEKLLSQAEELCQQRNVRLTPQRLEVLRLMTQQPGAISAYDLLDLLRVSEPQAKPPTVYRALDFLLENGLVHRISSLNAFIGCNHPEHAHQGQFLICRACHAAIELEQKSISDAIIASAQDVGFVVEGQTVEVIGLCSGCQGA